MFGYDILQIQQRAKEEYEAAEKRKETKEYKLELAKQLIDKIKEKFKTKSIKGDDLRLVFADDKKKIYQKIKDCYEELRELGWKEGISISNRTPFDSHIKYRFEINNYSLSDSLESFIIQGTALSKEEKLYITKEQEYSIKLAEGESFNSLARELLGKSFDSPNSKDREVCINALINASYRNGIEDSLNIFTRKFSPTFGIILKNKIDSVKCENFMRILHNKSMEEKGKTKTKKIGRN